MTHTLVMPPVASPSLPPPTPLCHCRTGLASEPLCPPETRDGLVPFPRSDEWMRIPGETPHKHGDANPDPAQHQPQDDAHTRQRTVRRKKSSLDLRENFLNAPGAVTSPSTETPEPSPVEPKSAQS
ncbi:hypothetical protein LXA43DRAFT_216543 [Ganoderma leucocontextum]|nr:hypothetical protein LXA43DRAFT_216543 [Ganoderma leucocontextum]